MMPGPGMTEILERTGALLKGHFLLTSGMHSDSYVQCALALRDPRDAELIGRNLMELFREFRPDLVAGPAMGGVILAHEVARAAGVPCVFSERENGVMTFRRGFRIEPGQKVLVVEDVITTGGSVMEVVSLVRQAGGQVVGVGAIVNRSGSDSLMDVPMRSLVSLGLAKYTAGECPLCRAGTPAVKPGSRSIQKGKE